MVSMAQLSFKSLSNGNVPDPCGVTSLTGLPLDNRDASQREAAEDTHAKSIILCCMLEEDLSEDATVVR